MTWLTEVKWQGPDGLEERRYRTENQPTIIQREAAHAIVRDGKSLVIASSRLISIEQTEVDGELDE